MAINGHRSACPECPLSGAKRTYRAQRQTWIYQCPLFVDGALRENNIRIVDLEVRLPVWDEG